MQDKKSVGERHDFIFDTETMSANYLDCAVIDFSCMTFSWDKFVSDDPYTCRSIVDVRRFKLDVKEQATKHGFKVSPDTVEWWSKQSKDAQRKIAPKPDDLSLEDFVDGLYKYLMQGPKIKYWWTRSNCFDPPILQRILNTQGDIANNKIGNILKHWNIRDTRTHIDAKFDYEQFNSFCPIADEPFWTKVFVQHDSSWDILADVLRLQAIARGEAGLEQVKR